MTSKVLVFDVNETLLDLGVLDAHFEETFGDGALRAQWFALVLQVSFVGGMTGFYTDFTSAQHAALQMLAEREKVSMSESAADRVIDTMRRLPPHPEVPAALHRLRSAGFPLVALTNSVPDVAEAQLTYAELRHLFDHLVSADAVGHLKPAPEPYRRVAEVTGADVAQLRLVAAHHWDVTGALRAGCAAAFVARPGAVLNPLGPQPDITGVDLGSVAEQILGTDSNEFSRAR